MTKKENNLHGQISFSKETRKTTGNSSPKRRGPAKGRPSARWSVKALKGQTPQAVQDKFTIKKWEKPVRIGSLMWLEQVGQCMFIEYENDMIIVDAGMEFAAKETMWADYIIPDVRYVKKNIKKLRGIVLSHWHLDHVWALRDLLPDLWYPTIYTTPLTLGIVKKTFDNKKNMQKIKYKIVNPETDILKLGCFTIEFASVNHNIPETMAMAIQTPKGLIFNSSDFKVDHTPAIGEPADLAKIARIWLEWVKLYIWDSLGASKKWWAPSEMEIGNILHDTVQKCTGRIIIATFASNVWRVIQLIDSAVKNDRIVYLSGRSMINNVAICQEIWYIKVPKNYVRQLKSLDNMPDERVMILCTWAQWEEFSALARMARDEHAQITLQPGDTVLVSASTIPWNEIQAMNMKDQLCERWVRLITNNEMDVHTSWHGWEEDHKLFLNLVKPDYFLPYYMNSFFRYEHKKLGLKVWIPEEKIMMPAKNWAVIEMYDNGCRISPQTLDIDAVLVDGKWKWHLVWEYVIKARQIMANDGIVNLIFKVDSGSKELVGNIQIESRGFVYSNEVRKVHTKIVEYVKSRYYGYVKKRMETKDIMRAIKDDLATFIEKEVGRSPMIVPMYVYISRDWTAPVAKWKPVAKKPVKKTPIKKAPVKTDTPVLKDVEAPIEESKETD